MSTSFVAVPAGATSNPIFVTPLTNVIAGPSVLGGSVSVLFSPTLSLPQSSWLTVQTGTGGGCFRPTTTGYVVVQATTSQGNVFVADTGVGLLGSGGPIVNITAPLASASTTSEVVLAAWKIAPGYFNNPSFRMRVTGDVSLSNNANVKTLIVRANGLAGTAMATSPSIASALNFAFDTVIVGRGDGVSLLGTGMLATQTSAQGGLGISTTANPTLSRDYVTQETEFVITATKATAGDTFQLENMQVAITS